MLAEFTHVLTATTCHGTVAPLVSDAEEHGFVTPTSALPALVGNNTRPTFLNQHDTP
jgi:hypothetical protein